MIVGGYSLDLYCASESACKAMGKQYKDAAGNHYTHYSPLSESFAGNSLTDCKRLAVKHRWKFKKKDVLCPYCGTGKAEAER